MTSISFYPNPNPKNITLSIIGGKKENISRFIPVWRIVIYIVYKGGGGVFWAPLG